jgi:GNAT superfamily N-acetyltransferase
MNITIRPAALADAPALGRLMTQLGYPATEDELARRLPRVISTPGHTVLVAVLDGQPTGLAHGALLPLLEDEGSAQLLALVVDEAHRGHGIGGRLVAAIEAWAAAAGAARIVVRSNIVRTRTHTFYENLGFGRTKIQLNFSKPLPPSALAET